MKNFTGDPALYDNPNMALEVMQELKASAREEWRSDLLDTLGALTDRDLVFYSLGKAVGHQIAIDSFQSHFHPSIDAALQKGQQ
jgi:hypothetical protein